MWNKFAYRVIFSYDMCTTSRKSAMLLRSTAFHWNSHPWRCSSWKRSKRRKDRKILEKKNFNFSNRKLKINGNPWNLIFNVKKNVISSSPMLMGRRYTKLDIIRWTDNIQRKEKRMYTRHEYKRYPVTLTYTCTKSYRKRMVYIGVCACAESRARIDKYVREHTCIDTERPKGK